MNMTYMFNSMFRQACLAAGSELEPSAFSKAVLQHAVFIPVQLCQTSLRHKAF
jgi:hypothetical protein